MSLGLSRQLGHVVPTDLRFAGPSCRTPLLAPKPPIAGERPADADSLCSPGPTVPFWTEGACTCRSGKKNAIKICSSLI